MNKLAPMLIVCLSAEALLTRMGLPYILIMLRTLMAYVWGDMGCWLLWSGRLDGSLRALQLHTTYIVCIVFGFVLHKAIALMLICDTILGHVHINCG